MSIRSHRLGAILGAICAAAWLAYALLSARHLIQTAGWSVLGRGEWMALLGGAVLAYAAPWFIVRGIAMAVEAFRRKDIDAGRR